MQTIHLRWRGLMELTFYYRLFGDHFTCHALEVTNRSHGVEAGVQESSQILSL